MAGVEGCCCSGRGCAWVGRWYMLCVTCFVYSFFSSLFFPIKLPLSQATGLHRVAFFQFSPPSHMRGREGTAAWCLAPARLNHNRVTLILQKKHSGYGLSKQHEQHDSPLLLFDSVLPYLNNCSILPGNYTYKLYLGMQKHVANVLVKAGI